MTRIPQFLSSLERLRPFVDEGPWSRMTRAALSAADTFPGVDGAVVCRSFDDGMRVAVGVSDGQALLAEQLEFTVGDGPGLQACRFNRQVVAGGDFSDRWPVLFEALSNGPGYQAVVAAPLVGGVPERPAGVLLLLYGDADDVADRSDTDRLDIAQLSLLIGHTLTLSETDLVGALDPYSLRFPAAPDVNRRLAVLTAVRMVAATCELTSSDAWCVVRGYAYSHALTVDDTCGDLLQGRLTTEALL